MARGTPEPVTLGFRVALSAIGKVFLFLRQGLGLVWNGATFDNAHSRRNGINRAKQGLGSKAELWASISQLASLMACQIPFRFGLPSSRARRPIGGRAGLSAARGGCCAPRAAVPPRLPREEQPGAAGAGRSRTADGAEAYGRKNVRVMSFFQGP